MMVEKYVPVVEASTGDAIMVEADKDDYRENKELYIPEQKVKEAIENREKTMAKIKLNEQYQNSFSTNIVGNVVNHEWNDYELGSDREMERLIDQGIVAVKEYQESKAPKETPKENKNDVTNDESSNKGNNIWWWRT